MYAQKSYRCVNNNHVDNMIVAAGYHYIVMFWWWDKTYKWPKLLQGSRTHLYINECDLMWDFNVSLI